MKTHLLATFTLVTACAVAASGTALGQVSFFGPTGSTDGTEADFLATTDTAPVTLAGGPAPGTLLEPVGGFDDGNDDPGLAISPIAFDDFTLEITGSNNTVDGTKVSTVVGELELDLFDGEQESFTFVFPSALTAFAAVFESPASTSGLEVTLGGLPTEDIDSFFLPGQGQGQQFLGFTTTMPFSTVTFSSPGDELFFLSGIQAGSVIPEPASLSLLLAAFAAAAARGRAR